MFFRDSSNMLAASWRVQEARKHARATTTQKCVRTNDIENVGITVSANCTLVFLHSAAARVRHHATAAACRDCRPKSALTMDELLGRRASFISCISAVLQPVD